MSKHQHNGIRGVMQSWFKSYLSNRNNMSVKISNSVVVMRRLHCLFPVNVTVKLYYSLVYSHLINALLAWGRSRRTIMLLTLSAFSGEHAHYSQIITKRSSLFTQFIIIYIYILKAFNTNALNFHQYFKDKLSSHQPSHIHNSMTQNK